MTYDTYGREVTCLCQPAEPMCEACRQLWSGVQAAPEKSTPGPWELKTCLRDEPKLTQLVGADGRHIADFHREADAMVAVQAPAMREALTHFLQGLDTRRSCGLRPTKDYSDWATIEWEARAILRAIEGA